MNAIPAFITSLSMVHDGKEVQLNVQCLNDIFFGLRIEQQQLRQYASKATPMFLAPHAEPLPMPDEEGTEVLIYFD